MVPAPVNFLSVVKQNDLEIVLEHISRSQRLYVNLHELPYFGAQSKDKNLKM